MKRIVLLTSFIISLMFSISSAFAGTAMVGFKGWYTYHDAWVVDYVANSLEHVIINEGAGDLSASSDTESGNGFLGGGILGYQTDDRLWAFSFAFMVLSNFENDVSAVGNWITPPDPMLYGYQLVSVSFDIEEKRQDYDVAVTYSLSDFFKIFLGYKYMSFEYTLNYNVDFTESVMGFPTGLPADYSSRYTAKSQFHIPSAGIGVVLPLSSKFIFGAQFGILYVVSGTAKTTSDYDGLTESEDLKQNFGYNLELNFSLIIAQSVILQAGYRQQYFKVEGDSSDSAIDSEDINRGITFSAIYLLNI